MNDDGVCAHDQAGPADHLESPSWTPAWNSTGPALDVDSEIEVRFAMLAARYGDMLHRFLHGLARRPDVAEDLVQQLWLKLLEAARAGRFLPVDDSALRSYLFAAARNLFLDECVRKHGSSRTVAQDPFLLEALIGADGSDARGSPEESCHQQQLTAEVHAAMQRLPESQRTVVGLWMGGASIESMVVATGACRDTVLSRKKYAFRRLKGDLQNRGVG